MLVHPHAKGFKLLSNHGTPVGVRSYVRLTQAKFVIDPDLQRQAVELGNRVTHAWVQGDVQEALYGRVPPDFARYREWLPVKYRPQQNAVFTLLGQPVGQQVFDTVVCIALDGHRQVLVPKKSQQGY